MLFAMIIGGLIGYGLGRFPGLLIGAAVGAFLFRQLRKRLLGKLQDIQSGFIESVFAVMGCLCKADGVVTRDEIQVAEAMFVRFRMNEQQKAAARNAFNRGKAADFDLEAELNRFLALSGRQPAFLQIFLHAHDAYKALGVSPTASDDEIKKAYRKLMSENHPDKLAGKGLPESMREIAEERTGEISHAYDVIKAARKQQA